MPPLVTMEIAVPKSDVPAAPVVSDDDDQSVGSLGSELSLTDLKNDRELQQQHDSGEPQEWDPNASDYSLQQATNPSVPASSSNKNDVASKNLLGGDYSLNVRLPKVNNSNNTHLLNSSQNSTSPLVEEGEEFDSDSDDDNATNDSAAIAPSPSSSPAMKKTKSSKKPKRKLSFYPRVKVHHVRHINQISDEEIESIWFSREEVKQIRSDCYKTIKMMVKEQQHQQQEENEENANVIQDKPPSQIDDIHYCSRGLEHKTPEKYRQRYRSKMEMRQVICEEQELQREHDMEDAEYLADLSFEHSQECVRVALEMAAMDERVARQIHAEGTTAAAATTTTPQS